MKYFPRARMVIIDGVGHDLTAEDPETVLAAVRRFLLEQNR